MAKLAAQAAMANVAVDVVVAVENRSVFITFTIYP